jgi:L-seryl-tRNA(Ser) seleniumtransferase
MLWLLPESKREKLTMESLPPCSRRSVVMSGLGSLVGSALAGHAATEAAAPTAAGDNIYQRLGVRTVINAVGTVTVLGGSLMPEEVKRAMDDASRSFVPIHELQAAVGRRLAELTGAEAAIVTAGASAALCLATCAVTAGSDPKKMDQLPDLTGMKSEIIIQRADRNPFDHAFRMVGVKLVEVETPDDVKHAINDRTAAAAFVQAHYSLHHKIELPQMIELAHAAGLPLIMDAAAELPPAENLSKFTKMGADLVAFSGGKQLRGPQCSGLLLGRKDLVAAAYANSSPHNHFARIAKVGKEEIVGLLAAVERYLNLDLDAERRERTETLNRVADKLKGLPTVRTEFVPNGDFSHSPRLSVQWDEKSLDMSVGQMVKALRGGSPSIEASDLTEYQPPWKGLGILAHNLQPGEELIVARRVGEVLTTAARNRGLLP